MPKLPGWMTPKVWGMNDSESTKYIDFDKDGAVTVGGCSSLQVGRNIGNLLLDDVRRAVKSAISKQYHW